MQCKAAQPTHADTLTEACHFLYSWYLPSCAGGQSRKKATTGGRLTKQQREREAQLQRLDQELSDALGACATPYTQLECVCVLLSACVCCPRLTVCINTHKSVSARPCEECMCQSPHILVHTRERVCPQVHLIRIRIHLDMLMSHKCAFLPGT